MTVTLIILDAGARRTVAVGRRAVGQIVDSLVDRRYHALLNRSTLSLKED